MAVADPHAALTAYLLGELDDERRREFETHLEGCAACRADVAELAPTIEHGREALPGPGPAPSGIVEATLSRVEPGRTAAAGRSTGPGRVPVLVGAAAVAVLLIAAIIAIASGGGEEEPTATDADAPTPAPELRAQLTGSAGSAMIEIDEVDSGRSISLSVEDLPPLGESGFYELWLVSASDTRKRPVRVSAGTFKPSEEGPTEATMAVGVAPARFDRIEVTRERDRLPNAGGDVVLRLETKGLIQLG